MEKVVVIARVASADDRWCERIRGTVSDELLKLGLPGLQVNVRDSTVSHSLMTLTTLDPPVGAVISFWTQQSYGDQATAAIALLQGESDSASAYLVTESVPMAPPATVPSERCPGLANVALLRRPPELDEVTWLSHWQLGHTPVAIATQATFGYVQNAVVRALTAGAPPIDGIVEELFPLEAVTDLHAFFGAADDADLQSRMDKMIASTAKFGANQNIDTVPTSRYVLRSPFTAHEGTPA